MKQNRGNPKGNPQNLTHRITSEEAREMGKKSAAVAKAKRESQAIAKQLLDLSIYVGDVISSDEVASIAELKGQNITVREAMILAQVANGIKGDLQAAQFVINAAGEKPAEKVEMGISFEDYVKTHKVKL